MTKLEFLVRAIAIQCEQLTTLADNQRELLGVIVGLKDRGEWVGLTVEEIEQCYESIGNPINVWALGRAIEAKLKEKNGW
jgi:hypothetical protein